MFRPSSESGRRRSWLGQRGAHVTRPIGVALILLVSLAATDQCQPQPRNVGPVPGRIFAKIPEPGADLRMAAIGDELSAGQTNTPQPETPNQFAVEGPTANQTSEVASTELNDLNLQVNLGISNSIDVPTGSAPSPLYGAQPFTQRMLRVEEFGPVPLGPEPSVVPGSAFPSPPDADTGPAAPALDAFLAQYITPTQALPSPFPMRMANTTDLNPWQSKIESFLGRPLNNPPAEGRPPGEDWAHQRYLEFAPEVYFNTAQRGARPNTGLRDSLQLHHYNAGEFGPGGLYHNTVGDSSAFPLFDGTTAGIAVRFHPDFPIQNPRVLWTFDGTLPPKLLQARYGEPIMMRHYNALPIDPAANWGFGLHTITTHEHNGHTPAESDGYTQAFFFPGQFYDYHWPMVLAGHDSLNTAATDPRAGAPNGSGGIDNVPGNWRETMSTHWFHDHMLDFTAQNVYKGNAAMMNYYSALDRGNEAINDGVNLRLPSGTALDWGNRDYDVNLMIADKAWDSAGQLFFNIFNLDGWLGDQMMVNWLWKPYLDVRARRYRFRVLNGSVSRYIRLALVKEVVGPSGEFAAPPGVGATYDLVPFYMIANDGNIMEHAVYFDGNTTVAGYPNRKGILPTQAIAERYDIVVDFAQFAPGTRLYLVNLLEHENGRRPHDEVDIDEVLDGTYAPTIVDGRYVTDPAVGAIMEFRVQPYGGVDSSMNPADYVAGGQKMIQLPEFTQQELEAALHRTFEFKRSSGTDSAPWTIKTDGGSGFNMDPRRLSVSATNGSVEIWHITLDDEGAGVAPGGDGGWSHPVHVHFEEGQIFKRGGLDPPEWEKWARKDVYRIGRMDDSTRSVDIAIRFREFLGTYMEHCHNTQHEDHSMLLRWDVENPGQVRVMPTPMPSWDGVGYVPSYALPTFRAGDVGAATAATADPDFGRLGN
jgi:FtsP/CotA-like multicopper oxidase with cupredoxin domain